MGTPWAHTGAIGCIGLTVSHPMTPYVVVVSLLANRNVLECEWFNTKRYILVHGFCLSSLFLMGTKELKAIPKRISLGEVI